MSTIILRVASRFLVPLGLLMAVFIYFKGHQTPGGGFVGGLVASVALIIHRMAYGPRSLHRLLRVRESTLIGAGLGLALVTAVLPLLLGLPFFTSRHGSIPLPATDGSFEWASVMFFDLGVMLVVCGVVMGMINALTEQVED